MWRLAEWVTVTQIPALLDCSRPHKLTENDPVCWIIFSYSSCYNNSGNFDMYIQAWWVTTSNILWWGLSFLSLIFARGNKAAWRDPEEWGNMFKVITQKIELEPNFKQRVHRQEKCHFLQKKKLMYYFYNLKNKCVLFKNLYRPHMASWWRNYDKWSEFGIYQMRL